MDNDVETAYLAGGCAWIMQPLLSLPKGVVSTRTGWMGGDEENPTEENPGGSAEVIEVIFAPDHLSYRGLLEVFFQAHRADLAETWSVRSTVPRSSARVPSSCAPRRR